MTSRKHEPWATDEPPESKEPGHDAFKVNPKEGEKRERTLARTVLNPTVTSAFALHKLEHSLGSEAGDGTLNARVDELAAQCALASAGDLTRGEAMLMSQAHLLDSLFSQLVIRASRNQGEFLDAADRYYKLAMRAQSQCRATIETLSLMKNPPSIAFVKQANIASGHQQVNNGVPAGSASRAPENQSAPIKLLDSEATNGDEWLDTRAPKATSAPHQVVETVAAVDRPKNRQG